MQIKFKTAYFINTPPYKVQADLLNLWQQSLEARQIKVIKKANIAFNDYALLEYPEQDALKKEYITYNSYTGDIDALFKSLNTRFRIMELVITPEDYL